MNERITSTILFEWRKNSHLVRDHEDLVSNLHLLVLGGGELDDGGMAALLHTALI
jgi:hypothetical protein